MMVLPNTRIWMTTLLFICFLFFLAACTPLSPNRREQVDPQRKEGAQVQSNSIQEFKELYGIEVVALRYSAAGHMLDFRFRVVDLDKAMQFFREDIKPYLVDKTSGKILVVPVPAKLGPARPTGRNPKLGITYWMFFGNPGLVKRGDQVTIVVGDYKLEDLIVE